MIFDPVEKEMREGTYSAPSPRDLLLDQNVVVVIDATHREAAEGLTVKGAGRRVANGPAAAARGQGSYIGTPPPPSFDVTSIPVSATAAGPMPSSSLILLQIEVSTFGRIAMISTVVAVSLSLAPAVGCSDEVNFVLPVKYPWLRTGSRHDIFRSLDIGRAAAIEGWNTHREVDVHDA
jgi:hypothetical protein